MRVVHMPKRTETHTHTHIGRPQAQANRYTGRLSCHSLVAHKNREWKSKSEREEEGERRHLGTGRFCALTRSRDTHFLPCPGLPCCLCELDRFLVACEPVSLRVFPLSPSQTPSFSLPLSLSPCCFLGNFCMISFLLRF